MASTFRGLPLRTRAYIALIILAGATTVLLSVNDLVHGRIQWQWLWIALLTLASGSATVHLASVPVAISVSETFVFTSALLFGASAGALTVALDVIVISFWSYRRGQALFKIAFNLCALPLTIWIAAKLFFAISGVGPLFRTAADVEIPSLVLPLIVFTVVYFSLSSWIITFAISLEQGIAAFKIWRENFLWISLNYFGGASVALLLVVYTRDLDLTFLVIVVPLLAVLYATYAGTIGRFEDANRHLTELNTLYMATIEALAMAIDAKDQVTHGHIRRVQSYAVGLASKLGVADTKLIRAVEAAALLHDMGKLAVPEYILNKPGPLTPAEFDRMKLHSSVGADILSSINFPYPVVPIVRHHHENWDGSGYPDGLKGTDIPIGARILSVVDCFDALTSDRPYRPRLSDGDATRILLERRGTMYDPLIVDKFLSVHKELVKDDNSTKTESKRALTAITRIALPTTIEPNTSAGLDDIAASTEEMLALYNLARALAGQIDLSDSGDIICKHLRRLVPASTCVFFVYEPDKDELVSGYASGDNAALFSGLRIARGERLSGWVAANVQTIVNSDPVLDLGEASRSVKGRLRSCLSTPLSNRGQLVGVLSVYSPEHSAFTDDHRRIIEVIARQVSRVVAFARDAAKPTAGKSTDDLTGLPLSSRLESFVASELEATEVAEPLSVVLLQVGPANSETVPSDLSDVVFTSVVAAVKKALRGGDVLSRHGVNEFAVLLTQTDSKGGELVCFRVLERLRDSDVARVIDSPITVNIAPATAPADGTTLEALMQAARGRLRAITIRRKDQPSIH